MPLTMTVSIGSKYGRHRLVVLVEHLAVVLRARLRHNNSSRIKNKNEYELHRAAARQRGEEA